MRRIRSVAGLALASALTALAAAPTPAFTPAPADGTTVHTPQQNARTGGKQAAPQTARAGSVQYLRIADPTPRAYARRKEPIWVGYKRPSSRRSWT